MTFGYSTLSTQTVFSALPPLKTLQEAREKNVFKIMQTIIFSLT